MPYTLVAFHAHPDDEALLTAGTMARAAAHGHRVVLVLATDGGAGLASSDYGGHQELASVRLAEAHASAVALGVARVVSLGYADSGLGPDLEPDPPGQVRFVRTSVAEAAQRLAAVLQEEQADVLLTYDENGGYGHRDHVMAHQVARRAADLAGTRRVLEATVPREAIRRAISLAGKVYPFPPEFDPTTFERAYTPRERITDRVDVRRFIAAKRASMRAHASQATADGGADRTLAALLRIPRPLFDLVFGREWFADPTRPAGSPVRRDIFEGL